MVGDGHCQNECFNASCAWDLDDCADYEDEENPGFCAPECREQFIGDKFCDEACYNEACNWDCGDCNEAKGEEKGSEPECVFKEPAPLTEWWDDRYCANGCDT